MRSAITISVCVFVLALVASGWGYSLCSATSNSFSSAEDCCHFEGWPLPYRSSIVVRHTVGGHELPVVDVPMSWSWPGLVANLVFYLAVALLAGIVRLAVIKRRFSVRTALAATALVAIILGVLRWSYLQAPVWDDTQHWTFVIDDPEYLAAAEKALEAVAPHARESIRKHNVGRARLPCRPAGR